MLEPQTVEEVCESVRAHERIAVRGGGTKWCKLPEDTPCLETRKLSGIIEYDPAEFTIIVRAGTTLREMNEALGAQGQYLPFDPMFVEQGATIGGTVATGMNGAGRLRYGGVRDFIIGVEFVSGEGKAIRGGGKVVKNAAGFDLPKLMVGSLGRLGVITELAFKVFPRPEASVSAMIEEKDLNEAVSIVNQIAHGPFDIDALELVPPGRIVFRIAGHASALRARLDSMRKLLDVKVDEMAALPEAWPLWRETKAIWTPVKVAVTPSVVVALEARLAAARANSLYSVACNAALVEWPRARHLVELDALLATFGLSGLAFGDDMKWLGIEPEFAFLQRVKTALDPKNKFGDMG